VSVLEVAIGDADGTLELHTSVDSTGDPLPFGHTVLVREDTNEISWAGTITVPARSLASLVAAGEIPRRVGILKVDTEGHDLAVVSGMGALDCDVIMVEHWRHLPHSLGACPWTADEMIAELAPRGFAHFALVVHAGEFVILKWDDAGVDDGAMGNLVFVHDRVLPRLLPDLLDTASRLAAQTVAVGRMYAEAAADRLAVVEHLDEELRRRRGVVAKLFGGRSPLEGLDR
jgi:hypothetical protein